MFCGETGSWRPGRASVQDAHGTHTVCSLHTKAPSQGTPVFSQQAARFSQQGSNHRFGSMACEPLNLRELELSAVHNLKSCGRFHASCPRRHFAGTGHNASSGVNGARLPERDGSDSQSISGGSSYLSRVKMTNRGRAAALDHNQVVIGISTGLHSSPGLLPEQRARLSLV